MKKKRKNITPIIIIGLFFILGVSTYGLIDSIIKYNSEVNVPHCVQGYWFFNTSQPRFDVGSWICVNTDGIEMERLEEVIHHEIGHEIFAEYCEQSDENFQNCLEATKK